MERFAVFVDGCASEASRSGVLGHSGFKYMCVLCGVFAHAMGHSHGKPCCDDCLGCNPTSAKVASSWRLRGAGDFNIHHVPWLGMSSPPRGDSVDSPDVVIQEVKNEFLVSSVSGCNLRSNVCVDLVRSFTLGSHLAFKVMDSSGEGEGIIAFDDWYRDHFEFLPHQRFWIAGLTLWGSLRGTAVHFLHAPHSGTGIARQPPPTSGLLPKGRVLELFSGIGGWSTALLDLGLVNEVFAVDAALDPCLTLAARHGVVCRTVQQLLHDATHQGFEVLQADIIDPSWWVATIFGPWFSWMVFSSPCVCFSGAGWKKGILTVEGKSLLRAIALAHVFGVQFAFGENVVGLKDHPHWSLVVEFARSLGLKGPTLAQLNLNSIANMQRPRLMMAWSSQIALPEQVEIVQPDTRVHDSPLPESTARYALQITEQQLRVLKDPSLQTHREPVGQLVGLLGVPLAKRVVIWPGTCLPTLMACYGRQHLLPARLLKENGLLTWLLYDERGLVSQPQQALRYLQPFEALWLLGFPLFGPHPVDPAAAMTQAGNSVSPFSVGQFVSSVLAFVKWPGEIPFKAWIRSFAAVGDVLSALHVVKKGHFFYLTLVPPPAALVEGQIWFFFAGTIIGLARVPGEGPSMQFACGVLGIEEKFAKSLVVYRDGLHLPCCVIVMDCVRLEIDDMCCQIDPSVTFRHLQVLNTTNVETIVLVENELPPGHMSVLQYLALRARGTQVVPRIKASPPAGQGREVKVVIGTEIRKMRPSLSLTLADVVRAVFPFRIEVEAAVAWDPFNRVWCRHDTRLCAQGDEGRTLAVTLPLVRFDIQPLGFFMFPPLLTVGECLMHLNNAFYGGLASLLMTANGVTVGGDETIALADKCGQLRIKVFGLRGGARGKAGELDNLTPMQLSTRLEGILAEKGVPASKVGDRAHEVYTALGTKTLRAVFSHRDPWSALKQEATRASIALVGILERPSKDVAHASVIQAEAPHDAWQEFLDKKKGLKSRDKARAQEVLPSSFRLDIGFFRAKGGPTVAVTPEELLQGTPGVAVVHEGDAEALLPSFLNKKLTVEPSALLVMGGNTQVLGQDFVPLVVPGWVDGKAVALQVAVLQTGDTNLEWDVAAPVKVEVAQSTTVCLVYVYPEEAGDKWKALDGGFDRFFRLLYPKAGEALVDVWGAGFFDRRKKVDSTKAQHFHAVARFAEKHLEASLRVCGLHGLYLQPRNAAKGLDPRFAVVRLHGFSREEAVKAQHKLSFQLGLVRTSRGFGLRVKVDRQKEARKELFPEIEVSSDSGAEGDQAFRLLGIPESYDRRAVKSLLSKVGWSARVGRAVGWKTWKVSTCVDPPSRAFTVDGYPVVVLQDGQQAQAPLVVASTASNLKAQGVKKTTVDIGHRGTSAPAGGPAPEKLEQIREELAADCDMRLSALEASVAELQDKGNDLQEGLKGVQEDVGKLQTQVVDLPDQVTKQLSSQLTVLCKQLQQDSDSKLEKIALELKAGLRERDSAVATQIQDLRESIDSATTAKTRKVAEGSL